MQLFYISNSESQKLEGEEFNHCVNVLRKKVKDKIFFTDGIGNLFKATISNINKNSCDLEELEKLRSEKKNSYNHIGVSIIKSQSRLEWMIEKLTEIGIDEISLIHSNNCERNKINLQRLYKKSISAIKQCNSLFLPKINKLTPLSVFLKTNDSSDIKLLAEINTRRKLTINSSRKKATMLIGPEGDFTDQEKKLIGDNGYIKISLSNQILRTETAAIIGGCILLNQNM